MKAEKRANAIFINLYSITTVSVEAKNGLKDDATCYHRSGLFIDRVVIMFSFLIILLTVGVADIYPYD